MNTFISIVKRDLQLAMRQGMDSVMVVAFFILAVMLFPFGVGPEALSVTQAARLAAILPSPKTRSASRPTNSVRKRTRQIIDGAATIRADGRSACFES